MPKARAAPKTKTVAPERVQEYTTKYTAIMTKYFGDQKELRQHVKTIDVSSICPSSAYVYFTLILLKYPQRPVTRPGVEQIKKSVSKHGVLMDKFWYIKECEPREDSLQLNHVFNYIAIDCNHRLQAWNELELKEAPCLVFPKTIDAEEEHVISVVQNEMHDSFSVAASDFEKFLHGMSCTNLSLNSSKFETSLLLLKRIMDSHLQGWRLLNIW